MAPASRMAIPVVRLLLQLPVFSVLVDAGHLTSKPWSDERVQDLLATVGSGSLLQCGLQCLDNVSCGAIAYSATAGDGGANCQLFGCPEDWTMYRGACYKFVSTTALWSDAEDNCQALKEGAHQTSIHSAGEVKLLSDMVVSFYGFGPGHSGFVFVGMSCSRTGPELLCQWTDGTPVVYAQWADEQIEGDGQFYVRTRMPPGLLYLDNIVHARPYFCKHKL